MTSRLTHFSFNNQPHILVSGLPPVDTAVAAWSWLKDSMLLRFQKVLEHTEMGYPHLWECQRWKTAPLMISLYPATSDLWYVPLCVCWGPGTGAALSSSDVWAIKVWEPSPGATLCCSIRTQSCPCLGQASALEPECHVLQPPVSLLLQRQLRTKIIEPCKWATADRWLLLLAARAFATLILWDRIGMFLENSEQGVIKWGFILGRHWPQRKDGLVGGIRGYREKK